VQYFNGYRYDAAELAELCHRYGAFFLLDGTQGVGAVPLDVTEAGVDALACGGPKWLFCQTGSGFLYLSRQPVRKVTPPAIGWLSVDWGYAFGDLQRHDRPLYPDGRKFEWGTYPYYSLRLAQAGLKLVKTAGVRRTFRHVRTLLDDLADFLHETPYTIASVLEPRHRSAILCFTGPRIAQLHRDLAEKHFRVSLREKNIRVSPHFYNTRQEMRRFIAAMRRFIELWDRNLPKALGGRSPRRGRGICTQTP
jgi:selenocysteine lyase/cysteine desulfurase